jgi:hypothetical protein
VLRQSKNYLVHDEHERATVGDTVKIEECRPVSKRKSTWRQGCVRPSYRSRLTRLAHPAFQLIAIVKEAPKFVNPDEPATVAAAAT